MKFTVKKGHDKVYPWELIDPDGAPIAKFFSEDDAIKAAKFFNQPS